MKTNDMILHRIRLTHQWLLEATEGLTEKQFTKRLSYHAPPIGWHLWHIARFADRLQASFLTASGQKGAEIWGIEGLAQKWNLDPNKLGIMDAGMEMTLDVAASIPITVGKDRIEDYASRSFGKVEQAISNLVADQLDEFRKSIRAYRRISGKFVEVPPEETTTGADLVFHINHASRHLGSIEGLRGVIE